VVPIFRAGLRHPRAFLFRGDAGANDRDMADAAGLFLGGNGRPADVCVFDRLVEGDLAPVPAMSPGAGQSEGEGTVLEMMIADTQPIALDDGAPLRASGNGASKRRYGYVGSPR
jgi:hypothetical protein